MAANGSERQSSDDMAELDPEKIGPVGTYTNFMRVTNTTPDDFVLEFGVKVQGTKLALMHTKLISSPTHTKRMLKALQRTVQKYEEKFGVIPEPESAEDQKTTDEARGQR